MLSGTPRTFIGSTTFTVTGMTCGHCERAVTEEISAVDGVESVTVDLATGSVTVTAAAGRPRRHRRRGRRGRLRPRPLTRPLPPTEATGLTRTPRRRPAHPQPPVPKPAKESAVTIAHEYYVRYREQELIQEAQRARLVRCLQPSRPWRRRSRRSCA